MATLLVIGMIGTLRMRKHAIEDKGMRHGNTPAVPIGTVLTQDQLSLYTGRNGSPVYVGIMGQVYDVTSGKRIYGPGGSYHFFAGRDASRAFVTGKFKEDLNDDVRDLSAQDMKGLIDWRSFYQNHESYMYVGKVVGRFYDEIGASSPLLGLCEMRALEYAEKQEEILNKTNSGEVVPCSFKWHKDTGGRVACKDGRYPRRVYSEEKGRQICRCLTEMDVNDTVALYEGCAPELSTCATSRSPGSSSSSNSPPPNV
jgi:predicted heme/steroid binding protein